MSLSNNLSDKYLTNFCHFCSSVNLFFSNENFLCPQLVVGFVINCCFSFSCGLSKVWDWHCVYWDFVFLFFFFSFVVRKCCLFWLDCILLLPSRKSFPTFPVLTDYQHPVLWEEKSVPDIRSFFMWKGLYRQKIVTIPYQKKRNKKKL